MSTLRKYWRISEQGRKNISNSLKGNKNWLGKKHSEETKKKMSFAQLKRKEKFGYINSPETRIKISESKKGEKNYWYGKKHSEKTKKKMSKFQKGKNTWSKGIKWSEERKIKLSKSLKGRKFTKEWLKKNSESHKGIKLSEEHKRKLSESHKMEKHWNWLGGKSFEPYNIYWTRILIESIRERDSYACQICGKKQTDRELSIHHIDYNKLNCNTNNLITLCKSCHTKTNYNRNYWIKYFNNCSFDCDMRTALKEMSNL